MQGVLVSRSNLIGYVATVVVLFLGLIFLGSMLLDEKRENERLRKGNCARVEKPEPCLVLELRNFQDMDMDGAIFAEGTCSRGSKAPYCRICGDDLSTEGRKALMRLMLEEK